MVFYHSNRNVMNAGKSIPVCFKLLKDKNTMVDAVRGLSSDNWIDEIKEGTIPYRGGGIMMFCLEDQTEKYISL